MTTFQNAPKHSPLEDIEKIKLHRNRLIFSHRPPKINNHSVTNIKPHPLKNYRKFWGYRYLFNMDEPVWTNSMCNKLGHLSQGWKKHAGTDTIAFIFHRDRKKTGGKPMLEQSVTSDHRKQRLKEQDTLQEEIL